MTTSRAPLDQMDADLERAITQTDNPEDANQFLVDLLWEQVNVQLVKRGMFPLPRLEVATPPSSYAELKLRWVTCMGLFLTFRTDTRVLLHGFFVLMGLDDPRTAALMIDDTKPATCH